MQITTSPDLTNLSVQVKWDISGTLPVISLVNLSTGNGLANVSYAFVATSPSGTLIHSGNINTPDKVGIWNTAVLTDAWPRPFNQIEWSGAAYSFYVIAKDQNGTLYQTEPQTAFICRPFGNTQSSKNPYGIAASVVSVKCNEARVYFQDTTYHSYKGLEGDYVGSTLRVIYPIDETATIPAPFQIANYTTALVPISYSSSNYQFFQQDFYDYDLGNETFVRIRYQTIQTFAVWCNVDLLPLKCEIDKLSDSIQFGTCADVNEAQQKMNLILPKFVIAALGILQPLIGVDVPAVINQIKAIGGFECDCCSAATGIIPTTSSIIDGYNFIINKVCGDINGTVTNNGTNIIFNLQDISYVVTVCNGSPSETTAFSFEPTVAGCQKTYCLKVDGNQLAEDILNIISSDSSLVNLFNTIVNNGGDGSFNLLVDGKCIFQTTAACNYTFTFLNIPATTTFAVLTSIGIDSVQHVVNFAFNETNVAALQAYLNTLGYGTFVVTDLGAGQVVISSTANTHNITSMSYSVASVNYVAAMTKNCTGYLPLSANEVVQNIINYLCDIDDSQIETSQDYEICYINPVTRVQQTVTISSGAALSDFITELLARGCDTINYIISLSASTCAGMKTLFPTSASAMQANDYLFGTKVGNCSRVFPVEFGTAMLQYGITDANFMIAFCNAVALCGGGLPCAPFNYFYLTAAFGSPADDTMNIVVNFQHPEAIMYTLRYARVDNTNTPTYITIPAVLTSPHVINVPDGQYFVGITPIYSDGRTCSETSSTTSACTGINAFSATTGGSPTDSFVISYSAIVGLPKIRVNIAYPNGGSFSQIYTNDGLDITIPFPTSVFGDFSITITPACNENTAFFGDPSAPVIINVPDPDAPDNYSIQMAFSASCRIIGTCNDAGICGVRYFISANGPVGSYITVTQISGAATVTITNSDPDNGQLSYLESNDSQNAVFNLYLRDSGSNIVASQTGIAISHNNPGAPWNIVSSC